MPEKRKENSVEKEINKLVENATKALDELTNFNQEQIDYIVVFSCRIRQSWHLSQSSY